VWVSWLLSQHVVNVTQVMFARHRNGHVVPVFLSVTPLGTEVAGIMQPIETDEHHILFREDTLAITAASIKSLLMMGVSLQVTVTVTVMVTVTVTVDDVCGTAVTHHCL
jgi:hypothetical protein